MTSGKSALGIVRKYYPNVSKVIDAKKGTTIHVSKGDCMNGTMKDAHACAMAKAAMRKHDGAIISLSVAYLIDGDTATRYKVPSSISREIVSFDRSKQFEPGSYDLSAVRPSAKLGPRKYPQPAEHPGKEKYPDSKQRHRRTQGIRSL